MNIYDFSVKDRDGKEVSLEKYRGKVLLIMNTAPGCLFAKQYEELQAMYEEMKTRDFEILDFPCNQFANEASGSNAEINKYCKAQFGISFDQYGKIDVRGDDAEPLFRYLIDQAPFIGFGLTRDALKLKYHLSRFCPVAGPNGETLYKQMKNAGINDIKWNFTKFLVDREGNVVARFEPPEPIEVVRNEINCLLNGEDLSEHKRYYRKHRKVVSSAGEKMNKKRYREGGIFFLLAYLIFILYVMSTTAYLGTEIDLATVFRVLTISMPGAVLFFIFYTITRRGAEKGMKKLSKALEEATSGNLDYRIEESHKSVLTETFRDYNRMCEQLKESMVAMEEAVAAADAANQAKSSFLSNMSHEIRTPLNAVLGMDEMIIRESKEAEIRNYAMDIRNAGRSLLSLINDILDLSKIEAMKMEIIPVEYDMSSVINDLLNMTNQKMQDKGLQLQLEIDEKMPHLLYGDEVRMKQVCLNILNNAVKYTDQGSICMNMHMETDGPDSYICFSVKDTGQGIKEEDMERLFSPFARIEEKKNRNVEGTGLGLSITKQLLELMGSRLEVDSVYGEGSTFHFRVKQGVVSKEAMGDFAERYRKVMAKEAVYQESFHAPNARILVVDDVEINLTVVKSFLKTTELGIDTALSGQEAVERAHDTYYDVIFVDHMMPDMDGFDTIKAIRADSLVNADTPMIALTANAVSGAREQYIAGGFDDYLTKPIDSVKLEEMLVRYLPEEKLLRDFESETGASEEVVDDFLLRMGSIPDIDPAAGVATSGGRESYPMVLKDFALTAEDRAAMIELYYEQEDLKNYTIQVHALKSSARIIGALALSKKAEELEAAGNAEDWTKIKADTLSLISEYRMLGLALSELMEEDEDKPLIDAAELKDAMQALQEALEVFDLDTADQLMAALDTYAMPDDFKDTFRSIKVRLTEVDRDGALTLIKGHE